jgi:hypothetical protein
LIAIVPISNEPPSGSDNCQSLSVGRGRAATVASSSPKLELPQHRYCKVESDQDKLDGPTGISVIFIDRNFSIFVIGMSIH